MCAWRGATSKSREDELDSCSADVTVGLQRVNVSSPGGTDLERLSTPRPVI